MARVGIVQIDPHLGDKAYNLALVEQQIVAPDGAVLAEASRDRTEMLILDIDPLDADVKHVVVRAGVHEMDCFADRRPELYGDVVRDAQLTEAR